MRTKITKTAERYCNKGEAWIDKQSKNVDAKLRWFIGKTFRAGETERYGDDKGEFLTGDQLYKRFHRLELKRDTLAMNNTFEMA